MRERHRKRVSIGWTACACVVLWSTSASGHLLVTEVGYDPVDETVPTAEFVEILNPGPSAVWLGNVWLANDEEAYPLLVDGPIAAGITLGDFVYRLPAMWLDPGRVIVLCHDSDAFLAEHFGGPLSSFTGQPGAPLLAEVTGDGEADGVPGLADWGSNDPGTLSMANNGECVGLAEWDGASDRVRDLDWVCWLHLGYIPNKDVDYPLGVDGPDPDFDSSFFLEDLGTAVPAPDAPQGSSIHRRTLGEPGEVASGGNGSAGHDETSEDWSGWEVAPPSPGIATLDATGVAEIDAGEAFDLGPVLPHPSAGPMRISFALPAAGHARVSIHDLAGRRVALVGDANLPAGRHAFRWDGRGERGARVGPGVYFVRLAHDVGTRSRPVVVAP